MLPQTRATTHDHDQDRISTSVELAERHPLPQKHPRSFWLHPLMGYLFSLPFIALGIIVLKMKLFFLHTVLFPGATFLLAVVLVAFLWGFAPAIFTLCLGVLALDYFYILPVHQFNLTTWEDIVQMLPFVTFGLLIVVIIVQRGTVLRRAIAAEYEQHQRANQLETILEAITDSVLIYDEQGMIRRSNSAARQRFPLADTQSLAERTAHLVICDEHDIPLPIEHLPASRVLRGEILSGAEAMDIRVRIAQEQQVQVSITGAPIRDGNGCLTGAVVVMRDVTKRRELERRAHQTLDALLGMAEFLVGNDTVLHEDETPAAPATVPARSVIVHLIELAQRVLGNQRVGVGLLDADGKPQPAIHVGFSAEQERQLYDLIRRFQSSDGHEQIFARLLDGEVQVFDMTGPMLAEFRALGIYKRLMVPMLVEKKLVGALLLDSNDTDHVFGDEEIALAQATAQLIALVVERQRLVAQWMEARANEMSLRETKRQMEEFLGVVSHELRTPLTAVMGNIQIADLKLSRFLAQSSRSPEAVSALLHGLLQLFHRADRQAELLTRLVNDLVDVSRIQAEKLQLQLAPCDLSTIVSEAVEEQRQVAAPRSIGLSLPSEAVSVVADADRIGQVVTNYLTNALKYSNAKCGVEVRLLVEGKVARVEVSDEGSGLSQQELERVWERFYQAQGIKVQSGSSVGLGIGLHICRTIITRHHGAVGVRSVPGQGSTFWFTLPLGEAEAAS